MRGNKLVPPQVRSPKSGILGPTEPLDIRHGILCYVAVCTIVYYSIVSRDMREPIEPKWMMCAEIERRRTDACANSGLLEFLYQVDEICPFVTPLVE